MPIVKTAASMLYHHLMHAGVKIYEFCERPLHGKVALVDDLWSTVGSSNLDPLSLSLNLEANVIVRDRGFNKHLHSRLDHLMRHSCRQVTFEEVEKSGGLMNVIRSYVAFHIVRWYPLLTTLLPRHRPRLEAAMAHELAHAGVSRVPEGR